MVKIFISFVHKLPTCMLLKIIGMEETAIKDNNYYKKFLENYLNDKKLKFDIKAYLPDFLEDPSASSQTHKASYQDSDSENDEDEVLTHKFQEIKLTYVDSGILLNYFCFPNHWLGFLSLLPLTSLKPF